MEKVFMDIYLVTDFFFVLLHQHIKKQKNLSQQNSLLQLISMIFLPVCFIKFFNYKRNSNNNNNNNNNNK